MDSTVPDPEGEVPQLSASVRLGITLRDSYSTVGFPVPCDFVR